MISIITAHYNSSNKINNLIDSLQKQTNKEFEWIVIDDCSCEAEFSTMKEQVLKAELNSQVLQNEKKGGPGVARNNGIKHCKGNYLTFVDCDDTISENFVNILDNLAKTKDADIIIFDYERIRGTYRERCVKLDYENQGEVDINTFLCQAKTCICGGLFRTELIKANKITFPQLYRYEDWVFNVCAVIKSNKIWYEKISLYQYIEAANSLVTSGKYDAGEYALKAFELVKSVLKLHSQDVLGLLYAREILYVNAINKAKQMNFEDYKQEMIALTTKMEYETNKDYLKKLKFHHRLVITLISLKMYRVVWILGKKI